MAGEYEKEGAIVERITLTIAVTYFRTEVAAKIDKLWIGDEEVPIGDRTISQCLEEMQQQGWQLTTSRATANLQGILCEYDFQRPRATPQRSDASSKSFAQRFLGR